MKKVWVKGLVPDWMDIDDKYSKVVVFLGDLGGGGDIFLSASDVRWRKEKKK